MICAAKPPSLHIKRLVQKNYISLSHLMTRDELDGFVLALNTIIEN